ncbi:DUF4421 family protein [uncultured Algibacter sp.]|uniref:DUF4421 family protein n=1 Tax=uncultured Algibacter sp. TaxID=298659 RepID=UPI00263698FA|nr:DUF4421 family protein [uncultured Algibacter sp.]
MIKKFIILFLFIVSSVSAQAQILKELDSLNFIELVDKRFVDHELANYSLRVFTNYKVKRFAIRNSDFKSRYVPNNKYGIGLGFASSKVLIDIAFNIKTKHEDVTRRFDMQGTTIIGKKNYVNFYVQSYKGYNVKNNFDQPTVFRDDIKSVTIGINTLRTVPDIEFSYSMLKAGLDNVNRKVYITGGFGAFAFYDYFSAEQDILGDNSDMFFNEQAHIKRYNSAAAGVLGGLLSVFGLPYNITATCNIMPGVGLMYKHVTLADSSYKPSNHLLLKVDYALALGYNMERYYINLIYGGGFYSTDLGYDNKYRFNLTKAKLAIGYKLGRGKKRNGN